MAFYKLNLSEQSEGIQAAPAHGFPIIIQGSPLETNLRCCFIPLTYTVGEIMGRPYYTMLRAPGRVPSAKQEQRNIVQMSSLQFSRCVKPPFILHMSHRRQNPRGFLCSL